MQRKIGANAPTDTGDDILMTDVLSFEIKAAWLSNSSFNQILAGRSPDSNPMYVLGNPGTTVNSDAPFDDIPAVQSNPAIATNNILVGQRDFDTWYRAP